MKTIYKNGVTGVIIRVKLLDSASTAGAGKTGLTYQSAGLNISTIASNEATATAYTGGSLGTITTLGTYSTPTTTANFKEVDGTNHPGVYEIHIPNARFAVANARKLIVSVQATGVVQCDMEIQLAAIDPYDAQRAGLASLPNANAAAAGGLPIVGSGAGAINLDGSGNLAGSVNSVVQTVAAALPAAESNILRSGAAQAGGANTITLDASAPAAGAFADCPVLLTGGTGAGQVGWAVTYNGTTKVLTMRDNWATQPDATTTFSVRYPVQRLAKDLLEADRVVDTTVQPWALVLIKKGSGALGQQGTVELLRQKLRDVTGSPITNANTILGQSIT